MALPVRRWLVGERRSRLRRHLSLALVPFVATFVGYATGVFGVPGGVVFLPIHAASIGMTAGAWIGYRTGGLAIAWIAVFASYLGFHAEWAFLGLAGRPLVDKLAFLFSPDGLALFGISSVVLGTIAFAGGRSAHRLRGRLGSYDRG